MYEHTICLGFSFSVFIKDLGLICPNDITMSFSIIFYLSLIINTVSLYRLNSNPPLLKTG